MIDRWWKLMIPEHKFGGKHTELKLKIVKSYLDSYLIAMRKSQFKNIYIDAFAGTGSRTQLQGDVPLFAGEQPQSIDVPGSVRLVLDIEDGFDEHIFIDKNPKHVHALNELVKDYPKKVAKCIEGDANAIVTSICRKTNWKKSGGPWGTRAVLFLDPYGMEVEWETLQAIAATQAIDLWFLFPISGLYRQAAKNWSSVDDSKISALNKCLGTDKWRSVFYQPKTQFGLFDQTEELVREKDVQALEEYVKERLKTVFTAWVSDPIQLYGPTGAQLYSLFFTLSNPSPKAHAVASGIVKHLKKTMR
jgi:three-Cys-motif partner protein